MNNMEKEKTLITCIIGSTVREVIKQAQELEIKREDIVNMFPLGGQIYLVFYK
jgi:hypothetical protein